MELRMIGSLEVSIVGLGCNNLGRRIDEARAREVVEAALDAGITLLDTADVYGGGLSEEYLGRILEGRRDRVVVATKFGSGLGGEEPGGGRPEYVRQTIEASLRRLRTDRIDLYQMHQPDASTPISDTLEVLAELVHEGKVRELGCSNFTAEQIREAETAVPSGAPRFVSVQNELNLLDRDDELDGLREAERIGLAYLPYFPLASGRLTGKYRRGEPAPEGSRLAGWSEGVRAEMLNDEAFDRIDRLARFAGDRGHTLLELAFAWLLAKRPVASVIAGATTAEQVRANVDASTWRLSDEELAALDEAEAIRR
jgi:aryl-alcohol dehydrogenase-like predicted oxidoreductase